MRALSLSASFVALAALSASASAYSTWTQSLIGVVNTQFSGGITPLDSVAGNGPLTTATATHSFTGLDGSDAPQTMTFSGTTRNSAEFGRLRSYARADVTNLYYNSANAPYADGAGGIANENGSPDALASLGFAGFDDTLQFGGALQAGYTARYIFHVDGTNDGLGSLADLGVKIGNDADESFFANDPGFNETNWATVDHLIDGTNPTAIHVQFSNQVVFNAYELDQARGYYGVSDFSSTLTLSRILVLDANGNEVSGVTVTSDSGTVYPVPEPAGFAAMVVGLLALRRRKAA